MFERIKQLDRQTVITLVLAGILGIFLFSAVTGGIRQAGWNEGYTAGLLTNNGEPAKVVAPAVSPRSENPASSPASNPEVEPRVYTRGYETRGWGGHPFGFIGGFFRFIFFGFLVMMVFKFIAFRRWRMHGGPHWQHHHRGPWGRHYENRPEGQPASPPQPEQGSQPVSHVSQPNVPPTRPNDWINV